MRPMLSSRDMVIGLKHYRSIAKQDIIGAAKSSQPDAVAIRAEARRRVYAHLAELAETSSPEEVIQEALRYYAELPLVSEQRQEEHIRLKAQEEALENFFVMVALDPTVREQVWSIRPRMLIEPTLVS